MRNSNNRNNENQSIKPQLKRTHIPLLIELSATVFYLFSLVCCPKNMVMRMSSSMVVWGMLAVLLLGMSIVVQEAQAQCAGADLNKLSSCLPASKAANVMPTPACCQALANFNSGNGEACLCAASTDPRFTSSGAKAQYAILIPQKCNLKYKAGYVCNGVVIPGGQ